MGKKMGARKSGPHLFAPIFLPLTCDAGVGCAFTAGGLPSPLPAGGEEVSQWGRISTDCRCNLYIASAPSDPSAVMGQLAIAHEALVGAWHPFFSWFFQKNVQAQTDLLRSGFGCFAAGPRRAMEAYRKVLTSHGCRPTLLRDDPRSDDEIRDGCAVSALVFNENNYVLAETFEDSAA